VRELSTSKQIKKRSGINSSIPFYIFISPWLAGFFLLILIPMLYSLYASFTMWNGVNPAKFIGVDNYKEMFRDNDFYKSIYNTFVYVIFSVPLSNFFALMLALLLNRKLPGVTIFRSAIYLPSVVAGVAVFIVWSWLYNPTVGLFNYIISLVGIQGPDWLGDPNWAMASIILMSSTFCGGTMLIYLAGLKDIPVEFKDAAKVEGASGIKEFTKITLPLLTPVVFFNVIMGMIGGFQIFAQPLIMTNGGPMKATYVYGIHLYNNAFLYYYFGYASALAWVLFGIIMLFSLLFIFSSRKWVNYGGDML